MTADQWLELAAQTDAKAIAAFHAGNTQLAALLSMEAERARQTAQEIGRLTGTKEGVTMESVDAAPVDLTPDALIQAANKHGMTLRTLAAAAGVSHSLLSKARRGARSLPAEVAAKIEKLTGFSASPAHWPGGIRD